MDQKNETDVWKNKKHWKKFQGILGALWLVVVCLTGCGMSFDQSAADRVVEEIGMAFGEGSDSNQEEISEFNSSPSSGNEQASDSENGYLLNSGLEEEQSLGSGGKEEQPSGLGEAGDESLSSKQKEETLLDSNRKEISEESVSADSETAKLEEQTSVLVEEAGRYTSKEEVALYIHLYGHLPDNYITKKEAENLGWNSKEGNLWEVAPGMSIGGSSFGNYEGMLPEKKGRIYFECDIDYEGGYRGSKRLIYSEDGLIFYTEDHYRTFEQLYGEQ